MPTDRRTIEEIERAIRDEIAGRLERRHGSRPIVSDEQTLEALGIDSLGLHELVDSLETTLCLNPFEQAFSLNDTRTVGDLCRAYRAVSSDRGAAATDLDETLVATQRRAEARRRRSP